MQVVITILLCFIIALGLFIVYAGLGGHRDHRHYYGAYDLDTLYRDRLFSWWNYPLRHDYYHHGHHGYHHGMGHTQNHGTQIVFSHPPVHHTSSPPPPPSKNIEFPLYSTHTSVSSTSSSSKPNVEGATTMAESKTMTPPTGLRMTIPTSSTSTMPSSLPRTRLNIPANTQTSDQGASLVDNARQMTQRSRVRMSPETSSQPTTTPPATPPPTMVSTQPVNASTTENVSTTTVTNAPSEGFQPNSYNLSCGSYSCAEP